MPRIEPLNGTDPVTAEIPVVTQSDALTQAEELPDAAVPKPRSTARAGKSKQKRATFQLPSVFVTLATAVALCVAVVGAYHLTAMARAYVAKQDRFRVAVRDIEVTPLPVWIRVDLLAEVQQLAGLPNKLNTIDERLSQELRDAFGMHPWVREVVEVRVVRPSQIRVKLTYREPVAAVHTMRSFETVDGDGVLLPNTGLPDPQLYMTITGVRSTPTGPAGTKWDDAALAAGIAVADALSPQHRTLGITTIDVSGVRPGNTNPGSVFLLTEHGTRVKWGRPPNTNYPGEVPVPDKIDRLAKYAAEHGSLDEPAGPYDIDITHWQEISLRPRNQSPSGKR